MKVRLVVVKGRPEGMEIPLPMPQFLIGRDPRCNLRPGSESVSKLHCAILQRKEGVFVRDLKSTNGTFVNNDRISSEIQVKDGDLVKVGPLVLAIKIEATEPVAAQPGSNNEEDQAVSWLLDYGAGGGGTEVGSKTTIMDMSGSSKVAAEEKAKAQAEADTKVENKTKKAAEETKKRSASATAEVASDLLEKLLSPTRKKKG